MAVGKKAKKGQCPRICPAFKISGLYCKKIKNEAISLYNFAKATKSFL